MSAKIDLAAHFRAMETFVEAQPEGLQVEIARGVLMMSPRPRFRHAAVQGNLFALLRGALGTSVGKEDPDWIFAIEAEVRSLPAFSRVIPDVAGWRRSAGGWPNPEENPLQLVPEWVGEVLSPSTEAFDRGDKREAYGLMGVGWLWLVDAEKRAVETYVNVRGKMIAGPSFGKEGALSAPPFETFALPLSELFAVP
jgi:Uma2 family endonuclease